MHFTTQQLIIGAIVVLALGQAAIFYKLSAQPVLGGAQQALDQADPRTPGSNSAFSVGRIEEPPGEPVSGVVTAVSNSSITVDTGFGIESYRIGPGVAVVMATPKTEAEINADLDVYNARVAELMQDPEGNREELENLILPPPFSETAVQLASIRSGQLATIYLDESGQIVKILVQTD